MSERDGWRHLYKVSRDGSEVRPITRGEFDVDVFEESTLSIRQADIGCADHVRVI